MLRDLCLTDLSAAEESALRSYKASDMTTYGRSKCFELNVELRNGLRPVELDKELCQIAESLDSVFERCPRLKTKTVVYRGIGDRKCMPVNQPGRRFRSLQYWSTSTSRNVTEGFIFSDEQMGYGAVLEIRLPVGFPAYNMETLHGLGGDEKELLLPRAVLWKVESSRLRTPSPILKTKFKNIAHVILTPESWD